MAERDEILDSTIAKSKLKNKFILDLKLGDDVTPALRELHWLPITEKINTKKPQKFYHC